MRNVGGWTSEVWSVKIKWTCEFSLTWVLNRSGTFLSVECILIENYSCHNRKNLIILNRGADEVCDSDWNYVGHLFAGWCFFEGQFSLLTSVNFLIWWHHRCLSPSHHHHLIWTLMCGYCAVPRGSKKQIHGIWLIRINIQFYFDLYFLLRGVWLFLVTQN